MGLVAAEIEKRGIATVCLSCLDAVTAKVRPPRWLALPFPLGYPLGAPQDPQLQRRVLRAALALARHPGPGPVRAPWEAE